jgi:hypothetical protein
VISWGCSAVVVRDSSASQSAGGDDVDENVPVDGVVLRRILAAEKRQSGSDLDWQSCKLDGLGHRTGEEVWTSSGHVSSLCLSPVGRPSTQIYRLPTRSGGTGSSTEPSTSS